MEDRKNLVREGALIAAIMLPFLFRLYAYMDMDLWYDEVFTLRNFVFVPVGKTVTDYSFPNNHIFFNLINNVYLKCMGVKDLFSLMDGSYRIRLPALVYTLATLAYIYLIGKKFFNRFVAHLSLIILVSTIPFYNFALQVRGYGLGVLLLCMMLYHVWSFEERPRPVDAFLVILSSALCLYTIPVNLYVVSGLMAFYLALVVRARLPISRRVGGAAKQRGDSDPQRNPVAENRHLIIVSLIGSGMMLAALLYLPVIDQMLNNPYIEDRGAFHAPILLDALPRAMYYFVSGRHLVVAASILGFIAYAVSRRDKESGTARKALCCAVMLFLPFLLSFIRGDRPLLRIFVNLTPVFALLAAVGIHFLQSGVAALRHRTLLITAAMILYCNAAFAFGMHKIDERIRSDIENGRKSQDIFYNYYQAHYYPSKLADDIARFDGSGPRPWEEIVVYRCDPAMPAYLRRLGVGVSEEWDPGLALAMRDKVYVVTSAATGFEKIIAEKYPHLKCKRINERFQYHHLFLLTRDE